MPDVIETKRGDKISRASDELIFLLREKKLKPYLYHRKHRGSIYIKFEDSRLGSIRVANHDGKRKYAYRWSLRIDMSSKETRVRDGKKMFLYGYSLIDNLVTHMTNYHKEIEKGDSHGTNPRGQDSDKVVAP